MISAWAMKRVGDRIDSILMRIVEILYGIPYLLIVILLMVIMEPGITSIIIALSVTGWVGMARIIRGQILQLKSQEYVLAALANHMGANGAGGAHVYRRTFAPTLHGQELDPSGTTYPSPPFTVSLPP